MIQPAINDREIEAVAIGASAGGVDALLQVLGDLPASFGLPILAVLHLPQDRDSRLAEVFRQHVRLPVQEAADKMPIVPGTLYFAGAGYHLSVERGRSLSLSCESPRHYSRPSIDILLESAADVYGRRLAAILLTGANQDGAAGLAYVKRAGGLAIVQNPAQAQVPTMPQAAIQYLQPDLILSLPQIHRLLLTLGRS